MFEQSEALGPADRDLLLLHLLQLVDTIANVDPAASARVLYDRIRGVLFRRYLIYRLSVAFKDLAGVARPDSSCEHGRVCADGDVTDREKIVLGMIVRVDVDFTSGHKDERRVDVDRELDVSFLISVQLKLCLLLCGLIEGLVLLLLVLHLLLNNLVNLAQPLSPSQYLRLRQFQGWNAGDSHLVDLRK